MTEGLKPEMVDEEVFSGEKLAYVDPFKLNPDDNNVPEPYLLPR